MLLTWDWSCLFNNYFCLFSCSFFSSYICISWKLLLTKSGSCLSVSITLLISIDDRQPLTALCLLSNNSPIGIWSFYSTSFLLSWIALLITIPKIKLRLSSNERLFMIYETHFIENFLTYLLWWWKKSVFINVKNSLILNIIWS